MGIFQLGFYNSFYDPFWSLTASSTEVFIDYWGLSFYDPFFTFGYGYFGYPLYGPRYSYRVIIEIDLTITMLTLPILGAPVDIQPTIHQEVDVPAKTIIVQIIQVTILSEKPIVTTISQLLADIMSAGYRKDKPMVTNLAKTTNRNTT